MVDVGACFADTAGDVGTVGSTVAAGVGDANRLHSEQPNTHLFPALKHDPAQALKLEHTEMLGQRFEHTCILALSTLVYNHCAHNV